jgi:glycosyltransferase involved in cell wall biosynthesis
MAIEVKILGAGAKLPSNDLEVKYDLYEPCGHKSLYGSSPLPVRTNPNPLVSCLMVTRGDRPAVKYAIGCYKNQLYANKELIVIVDNENLRYIEDILNANSIDGAKVYGIPYGLTLGDLRNMSIARAQGDILMQWDDDDLYDPLRIKSAVAILTRFPAAATLLSRLLIWWPDREVATISGKRLWEGSIAMWREYAPVYPSLARGEDTPAVESLTNTHQFAIIDSPLLYVYVITGANTWNTAHFEQIISDSECVFAGKDYQNLIELLSHRTPIRSYQSEIQSIPCSWNGSLQPDAR